MGTYHSGPLGDFSGKIGNVVGSTWRGKAVMRSLPIKSTKAPTLSQQVQRDKFKAVMSFLNPIKELLNTTFGNNTQVKTPFNNATSYHLKEAMVYDGAAWQMVYPKVLISAGSLQGLQAPVLSLVSPHSLLLQWTDNSPQGYAYTNDLLLVVVFAPALGDYAVFVGDATREDGTATLQLPEVFTGQTIETWASFITATGDKAAVSSYLGAFVVT